MTVLRIETALAKASLTRVEMRDPYKIYHRLTVAKLQKLTPSFRGTSIFEAGGVAVIAELNVTSSSSSSRRSTGSSRRAPRRLEGLPALDIGAARPVPLLALRPRGFDFYRGYLRGVKEDQPRWKRCVGWVDQDLGEALGQVFVERNFPPAVKAMTVDLVQRIEKAMEGRIQGLAWMSAATKQQALAKLRGVAQQDRLPGAWADYRRSRCGRVTSWATSTLPASSRAASSPRSASRSTAASGE